MQSLQMNQTMRELYGKNKDGNFQEEKQQPE
jgi:hypothetical protein